MGETLTPVDLGDGFVAIWIGGGHNHFCALSSDKELKCWGNGAGGALGQGDNQNRGNSADDMGDNLKPIDLGSDFEIKTVYIKYAGVCAVSTANDLKCWGWNHVGQLGLGDTNHRGDNPNEMGDFL